MIKRAKEIMLSALCLTLVVVMITGCGKSSGQETATKENDKPYYYNEENNERYEAYKTENPELTEDEVIWHVEADLDKTAYEDMTVIDQADENNDLLLVNKHFCFREGFEPEDLVDVGDGQKATSKTAAAYEEMSEDAKKESMSLNVRSGYRSIALQTKYYNNYKNVYGEEKADMYSAKPRSSEHHTGRALDIVADDWSFDTFENTAEGKWLHENAWKYGFILRYGKYITDITGYAYESWHVTFVGKEAAKTMKEEGIKSLEEYWVKYVKYEKTAS